MRQVQQQGRQRAEALAERSVGGDRAGVGFTGERARAWGWLSECGCDAGRCRLLKGIVLRSGGRRCVCA